MKRNLKFEGIIFKNYRIGDIHKGNIIFSPDHGILYAAAYGGYKSKSKLGSAVEPMTKGYFLVYSDPVKKSTKIIEYSPGSIYTNIKSNLKKYYTALLWFEIIIKSHGGGEAGKSLYNLLSDSLAVLDSSEDRHDDRIMIQFLMRCILLFGGTFQSCSCEACGKVLDNTASVYYSMSDRCFSCRVCINEKSCEMYEIVPGIRKYVEYTLKNDIRHSLNTGIDNNMLKYFKSLLYSIIQDYTESSLSVLSSGREFLD